MTAILEESRLGGSLGIRFMSGKCFLKNNGKGFGGKVMFDGDGVVGNTTA